MINTVTGEMSPKDIGRSLPHEHLVCDFQPVFAGAEYTLNDEDLIVDELNALSAQKCNTIVEVTPIDLGRDPVMLQAISERANINVIMSTGWYRDLYYPPEINRSSTNALADIMIEEIVSGWSGTGIKAGIIGEIGVDGPYITGAEERVLRAAARASNRTGVPITTHSSIYPVALDQVAILLEEGVDPSKIIVGHCDTYLNRDYHEELLKKGVMVQFDTIGREHMNPDVRRASVLIELVRRGWLSRLLISSDRCLRSDLKAFGGLGYDHVFTGFKDLVTSMGLSEDEFEELVSFNLSGVFT